MDLIEETSGEKQAEEDEETRSYTDNAAESHKSNKNFTDYSGKTTAVLSRTERRERARGNKKPVIKSAFPLLVIFLIVAFCAAAYGIYNISLEKEELQKEIEVYGKTVDKGMEDYKSEIKELGKIGNLVYMPDKSGFENRKVEAMERLEKLEKMVDEDILLFDKAAPPAEKLTVLNNNMLKAFKVFKDVDIKEMREFIETLDPVLATKMMSGYLSQTPFNRAVSVSEESSGSMDKAIEIWYNLKH